MRKSQSILKWWHTQDTVENKALAMAASLFKLIKQTSFNFSIYIESSSEVLDSLGLKFKEHTSTV